MIPRGSPSFTVNSSEHCWVLMSGSGPNPDFLLGGRTSGSAESGHWSGRAVRWSSCAIAAPTPAADDVPARRGRPAGPRRRCRAPSAPRSGGAGRRARARPPATAVAADVAAFVKRDADFKPLVRHWVSSRIVPRTEAVHRMPVACDAGCKARTQTDEGAILP